MSAPRLLAVLALTAVLATACGSGSSSNDGASSGSDGSPAPAPSGSVELRPVYARYAQKVPDGDSQLGPTVPEDLLAAMKSYDCSSDPTELQGKLVLCSPDQTVYLLDDPISSGGVASATPKHIGNQKDWFVTVQFDDQTTGTLAQATQTMPGTELAVVLEDQVLSAPIVDSSMADGHLVITGTLDQAQATTLAHGLSSS